MLLGSGALLQLVLPPLGDEVRNGHLECGIVVRGGSRWRPKGRQLVASGMCEQRPKTRPWRIGEGRGLTWAFLTRVGAVSAWTISGGADHVCDMWESQAVRTGQFNGTGTERYLRDAEKSASA